MILSLSLLLAGCNAVISNDITEDQSYEAVISNNDERQANIEIDDEKDTNDDSYYSDIEPWTIEDYLGSDLSKLSEEEKTIIKGLLDELNDLEFAYDYDEEKIILQYEKLNGQLRAFGIAMPYGSIYEFAENNKDKFSNDVIDQLIDLENEFFDADEDRAIDIRDSIVEIFNDHGFDGEEVMGQIESRSIDLGVFKVEGDKLVSEKPSLSNEADGQTLDNYKRLVDRAIAIVPDGQEYLINKYVVNTDGLDNILAYVVNEDESMMKWRMVLDVKDAFDKNGEYRNEYDETIVHEYGHILTLNYSQMTDESRGTYETEEGILREKSYLNQFYNAFWKDIKDDYDKIVDPMDQSGESAYDFYEKYSSQFVTDYAATNPEEDIAESFRVFVFSDYPENFEIKDKKVKWFYGFEELVKVRDEIRKNLDL